MLKVTSENTTSEKQPFENIIIDLGKGSVRVPFKNVTISLGKVTGDLKDLSGGGTGISGKPKPSSPGPSSGGNTKPFSELRETKDSKGASLLLVEKQQGLAQVRTSNWNWQN